MSLRLYRNRGACGGILSSWLFVITGLVCGALAKQWVDLEGLLVLLKLFFYQTEDNEYIKEL